LVPISTIATRIVGGDGSRLWRACFNGAPGMQAESDRARAISVTDGGWRA
jgi:hypothetical protein